MDAENILKIIDALPEYIKYIYPGYLSIYLYLFFRGKTLRDNNYIFLKAISISYIYMWLVQWLGQSVFLREIMNTVFFSAPKELKQNICLLMLSIVVAYIFYRIAISSRICKILELFKVRTTFYDNEIEALADFNEGAWLVVYLKDDSVVYEGSLGEKEMEADKRQYICLNAYYKYFLGANGKPCEPYIEDHGTEPDEKVMIFYDSIKRIEKRVN